MFLFDEPTAGMSVDEVPVILDLIQAIKDAARQHHPAGRAQDGRGALARRPRRRAAPWRTGGRRRAGEVVALPIVQEAYLGVRRRMPEARRSSISHGVHTHIGPYHILHGVDLTVPRGALTMLLGRNGAGKTTTLRTIMGLWHASAGPMHFRRRRHHAPGRRPISPAPASPMCRRPWASSPTSRCGKTCLLAARSGPIDEARLALDLRLVPGAGEILVARGRRSLRRTEADAVDRPRHVEPRKLFLIDEPTKGLAPAIIANMIAASAS